MEYSPYRAAGMKFLAAINYSYEYSYGIPALDRYLYEYRPGRRYDDHVVVAEISQGRSRGSGHTTGTQAALAFFYGKY